jgi:uncharacterized membrane protein
MSEQVDGGRRWFDVVEAVAGATTVAAMIATPLLPQRGAARKVLSSIVVTGLFATTTANAVRTWGVARAGTAAGAIAVLTGVVERVGTQTGLPFGRYSYTNALRPQIAHVPAIVPLAWFAMSLPSREAAHAALGEQSTVGTRLALGSAAMTAWDLFLDPQMVGESYWAWARRGVYRGIPLSNFLGWFVTGLGVMALLEVLLPTAGREDDVVPGASPSNRSSDPHLVGTYTYMSVMETLGFAKYFKDPVVAAVGGAAMLPIAATALTRRMTS